jgi:5-methylcytosine-specific restriction endonuclease McrA
MQLLSQQVLRTDVSGMPLEWINFRDAVRIYHLGQVAYACGKILYKVYGGNNAITHMRSMIEVNSIIATRGESHSWLRYREKYSPPLNNNALFARDAHICMYCGNHFKAHDLSRDHIMPISKGGQDDWKNVVTACKRCNNHKAGQTPERSNMQLLAVPFVPTHAEYVYLQGKRVLADQMEFLAAHFPRTSPLHDRLNFKN